MAEGGSYKASSVGTLMSSPVVTATAKETIAEVATRMRENKVGSVVVVDDGRVSGIFTERDALRFAGEGTDPDDALVGDWMTPDPDTVTPDESVQDAYTSLAEHGYRHIPVVSDENLDGIVSLRDLMRVARIQPVTAFAGDVPPGLEGVAVAETEIGDVRGKEGFFHYRQYSAVDLAAKRSIEDIWYLLYEGELPDRKQRDEFIERVKPMREIPQEVKELLPSIATLGKTFRPLEAARVAYALLASSQDFHPTLDVSAEELKEQALQTCAVFPSLVCALYRLKEGHEVVDPHPDLPYAANYLYMMRGEEPPPEYARAIEKYLMLTIDHGFNASTFTARVITSTGADLGSAVVGAIGALSGPLHGGAPSRALEMLDDIGSPDNADAWLRDAVQSGKRLMGFGHRVYKTDDPRSMMLRGVGEELGGEKIEFAKVVEKKAVEILEELKPGRNLYPNVEYYAGLVMDMIEMPPVLFTPTFACSRVIGWTAHILEQAANNRLIRPSAHYTGPEPPQDVPDP